MLHHSYKFESVSSNLTTPPLSIIKKLKNAIKSQCLVSLKRKRPTSTKSSNSRKNPENGFRKGVIKYSCHLIHSIFIFICYLSLILVSSGSKLIHFVVGL